MTPAVFDTDVLSYIFNDDPRGEVYLQVYDEFDIRLISFITYVEMRYGGLARQWGNRRMRAPEDFLSNFTVIQTSPPLCRLCVDVQIASKNAGRVMSTPDAWIASTASMLQSPLVSINRKHYEHLDGLTILTRSTPDFRE